MLFYLHIGGILDGSAESNQLIDTWIHGVTLGVRLDRIGFALYEL
jgi:hypothetical protein